MIATRRVVVIEPDPRMRKRLRESLNDDGWLLVESNTGSAFLNMGLGISPDLFVVNLELPDMDGLRLIAKIREQSICPVMALTVIGDDGLVEAALDVGADDVMVQPIRFPEMQARLRALLRRSVRSSVSTDKEFVIGGLRIDLLKRTVFLNEEEVSLTQREFSVLSILTQNVGQNVTQQKLLEEVWGSDHSADFTYVRMYIARLRSKLEPDRSRPVYLRTVAGVGYKLVDPMAKSVQ